MSPQAQACAQGPWTLAGLWDLGPSEAFPVAGMGVMGGATESQAREVTATLSATTLLSCGQPWGPVAETWLCWLLAEPGAHSREGLYRVGGA